MGMVGTPLFPLCTRRLRRTGGVYAAAVHRIQCTWLRVFGHAEASHRAQEVRQHLHTLEGRQSNAWHPGADPGDGHRRGCSMLCLYAPGAMTGSVAKLPFGGRIRKWDLEKSMAWEP